MKARLFSLAALVALAVAAGTADARPPYGYYRGYHTPYYGSYYRGYHTPYYGAARYSYPGYYGYGYRYPTYSGYYRPGVSISVGGYPYYGGYYSHPGYYRHGGYWW